jgi:glycosyltransferase involved in cell wall biosynthesis
MTSRRVLILTGEDPKTSGGMEHFVRDLARILEDLDYSAEVCYRGNSVPSWLGSPKTKIGRYIEGNLLGYFVARNARKRMGADVAAVISNGDLGWCASAPVAPGAKRIHIYHGTYRAQAEAIRRFISCPGYLYLKWWCSNVLERLGARKKTVLCNSDQTREEVSHFFGHDGAVVWLPLDTTHFRPMDREQCRTELGFSKIGDIGLFVGSIAPMKNFSAVRALTSALPDIQWILAIRGEVPRDFGANPRVQIRRNVAWEELPTFYNAASFSVCPSFYEPFGYVVAESLACGTPVIASPGGASRAFLEHPPLDRLLISDPSSVDQFVAAAREVMRSPEFYRQAVEEFILPKLAELLSHENWSRRFCQVTGL